MIRTHYKEVEELARTVDMKISAYDFGPSSLVFVLHEEGTTLTFRSAFIKEFKDYIIIFTEHHGTHVYHRGDLSHWGQYTQKADEKLLNTGYKDTCEFCGKEANVEDLIYDHHPDWNKHDDYYHSYCADCKDIEQSDYTDLWRFLNKTGASNGNKQEPWGFTWGRYDINHVKKALATVIKEEAIDAWLDTPSPSFRKTPRHAFEQGDGDEIYLMAYQMGSGQFL